MKKIGFVLLFVAALASPALAGQIQVGYPGSPYGMYSAGSGGEFTIGIGTSGLSTTGYFYGAGETGTRDIGVPDTFQSFCLELSEVLYGDSTPWVAVSSQAIAGGVGPAGDPISEGTTYLYSQFATGALGSTVPSYRYAGGVSARQLDAAAFQEAIWGLEGEKPYNPANPYIIIVDALFGGQAGAQADAAPGAYGVYVLNVWGDAGLTQSRQDLLYHAPVPDGGATLTLLGGVLLGLGALRRKFRV
jgi:hypothetical protein